MSQPTRPSHIEISNTFHVWRKEINKIISLLNYYILETGFKASGATIDDSLIKDTMIQQSVLHDSYVQNSTIQSTTFETGRIERDVEIHEPEIKGEWNFNKHAAELRVPYGSTEDRKEKGTGKIGEIFFDTDRSAVYVFDGSTVGGSTLFGSTQPDSNSYAVRTEDGRIKSNNATDQDDLVPLNQTEDLIEDHTSIPLSDGVHGTKLVEDLSEQADEYQKISTNETVKAYVDDHIETDLTVGAHGTKLVEDISEQADDYQKISTNETVKAYVDSRTTDDIDEGNDNLYYTEDRVNDVINTRRSAPGGVAALNNSGIILESQLPAIAITETTVVNTITDRDGLSGVNQGDIVIVEDATSDDSVDEGPATYIWTGTEWKKLRIPLNQIEEAKEYTDSEVQSLRDYTDDEIKDARQYTDDEISSHADETTNVHGITNGDIESTVGAQEKADAAETASKEYTDDHSEQTTGVHGITDGDIESTTGAQEKADGAETAANEYTDDHSEQTTDVHGITDGDIESTTGAQEKADAAETAANEYTDDHSEQTIGVHGVTDGSIESTIGAQEKADAAETASKEYTDDHSEQTTGVHGITDGDIESTVGAQEKADAAETSAKEASLLKEENLDDLTDVSDARNNLGLKNGATTKFHFSTDAPEQTDGEDGDVWFQIDDQ